jgi:GAF domain/PilZ domain/Sel1 repeat
MDPTGPKLAGVSRQSRIATERRHTVRHRAHSPAYASLNEDQTQAPELSEILDISEGGMSIQTPYPLLIDHDLSVCLDLSETRALISTTGHVVWSDSAGRAGIRFAKLSGPSLRQLKEWLFVNVLTAFDHAREISPGVENWNSASNDLLPSHTMPKEELHSGALVISGNGDSAHWGATLDQARAYGTARADATKNRVNREIEVQPGGFDGDHTLQSTAERALILTRATGAAIALAEGNDSEMTCVASAGSDAPPVGSRVQSSSGFSGECVRSGRSLRCDDSENDDRVDRAGCRSLGIRSIVAVPIRKGNKVAGLIEVFSPHAYAFNAEDIGTLQELGGAILSQGIVAASAKVEAETVSVASVTSPAPTRAMPIEKRPVPVEKLPAAEVAAPTAVADIPAVAAKPARRVNVQRVLLVAAVGTFVFAVLWLIAPWVSNAMRSSAHAQAHVPAPTSQTAPPKAPSLPAGVTDLASLRKVAEQGDPAAQFSLGARYATGEGVTQDYAEAVHWFTLAAEQGHILAQATLGAYYWAGRGVPQDLTKAYYWSVLAQAGGDQASKYRVAVLTSRMSRGQVVAAQQQADDWLRNFAGKAPLSR